MHSCHEWRIDTQAFLKNQMLPNSLYKFCMNECIYSRWGSSIFNSTATRHATHGDGGAKRHPELEVGSDEAQLLKHAGCSLPSHFRSIAQIDLHFTSLLLSRLQPSTALLFCAK